MTHTIDDGEVREHLVVKIDVEQSKDAPEAGAEQNDDRGMAIVLGIKTQVAAHVRFGDEDDAQAIEHDGRRYEPLVDPV